MGEHGTPFFNELQVPAGCGAGAWWGSLLGWEVSEGEGYCVARRAGVPVAGVLEVADSPDASWVVMVQVGDAAAAGARAAQVGGCVLGEFERPQGRVVVVQDPAGVVCGLIEPAAEPFVAVGEPGTPVFYELSVQGSAAVVDAVIRFYCELFEWDARKLGEQGAQVGWEFQKEGWAIALLEAHVVPEGEDQPAGGVWVPVFGVQDVESTVQAALDADGLVRSGAGIFVADPWGAQAGLAGIDPYEGEDISLHEGDDIFQAGQHG